MRSSYNFILSQILDILVNFFEILPIVIKVKFRYRRSKFVEIFIIKGSLKRKKKSFFKILNEIIVIMFFSHIRDLRIIPVQYQTVYKILILLDLKFLYFFAKFLPLRFCVILNIQFIVFNFLDFLDFTHNIFFKKIFNNLKNGFKNIS
jgi:hypothetical protein